LVTIGMENIIWDRLNQKKLTLDQTTTPLEMERSELQFFYDPLALHLLKLAQNRARLLVAVAGPPGSGKTSFAALLVAVINAEMGRDGAVLIQQDGWHYYNDYLDTHFIHRDGQEIPLRRLKGCPETYDTAAALTFLEAIKQGQELDYPVYSRQLHDPLPHAGTVKKEHQVVVIEGNYWLLQEPPWSKFQPLFDVSIFLTAESETLLDGLRQRHLRGGKTLDFITPHMARVDLPNIERVLNHSAPAQILVHKTDSRHISRMEYRSDVAPE
jgi:putative kinase